MQAHKKILFLKYFCRLLPESPRWLIAKGRVDEANVILHKFAKANGMSYPEEKLDITLVYVMSQGLLGLCCSIETRDCIERITLTAVLFE